MSFGCVTVNFCRTLVPFMVTSPSLLRRRKFHSTFRHWIACIEELGAPYWYSGEANEEFHKIAAKAHTRLLLSDVCGMSARYQPFLAVGLQADQQARCRRPNGAAHWGVRRHVCHGTGRARVDVVKLKVCPNQAPEAQPRLPKCCSSILHFLVSSFFKQPFNMPYIGVSHQ